MHSVANLATLQTPLATFFPLFKKAPSDKSLVFAPGARPEMFKWVTAFMCLFPQRTHLFSGSNCTYANMMLQTRLAQKFPIDKSITRRWSGFIRTRSGFIAKT